jgi:hypothetical protein
MSVVLQEYIMRINRPLMEYIYIYIYIYMYIYIYILLSIDYYYNILIVGTW